MALLCPAPAPDVGMVRGLLGTVDCNINGLTAEGYALLSGANSPAMALLTGLLTIYVGFIGYRMMLGRSPLRVGDLTISAMKIGAVVLLATNWGAYQTVAYDTLFKGPEQLAGTLLSSVQPQASIFRGNPYDGLQIAFDELSRSANLFAGRAGPQASVFLGGAGFAAFALNTSAMLLLVSSLGVVLASKIVLALLLALAPVFAALLLFDTTRGMLEGWLKAAVALALAPLLTILLLALQLTLIEPTLLQLAEMRNNGQLELGPPTSVFVMVLVFQGVLLAAAVAALLIASGLRLAKPQPAAAASEGRSPGENASSASIINPPSRAAAIAAAAAAIERRDSPAVSATVHSISDRRIGISDRRAPAAATAAPHGARVEPLGRSFRRSAAPRRSAAGSRRDR